MKNAIIKVKCEPNTFGNLRPIITVNGKILEWQLLIAEPAHLDYCSFVNGLEPEPNKPIVTKEVVRFHPDDVQVSPDVVVEMLKC